MLGRNVLFPCPYCKIHSWLDFFLEACVHCFTPVTVLELLVVFFSSLVFSSVLDLMSQSSMQLYRLPLLGLYLKSPAFRLWWLRIFDRCQFLSQRVRFCFYHVFRTRSYCELHEMTFRINLFDYVMSRLRARK